MLSIRQHPIKPGTGRIIISQRKALGVPVNSTGPGLSTDPSVGWICSGETLLESF